MRRFPLLALALLLTGCGDIPQPFRHEGDNPAMAPQAARGVVVRPLDDSPRSTQLADAIVRSLLEAEIPASTQPVVPGAWVIGGEIDPTTAAAQLRWTLTRPPGGEVLGKVEQSIPAGAWGRATPKTINLIAAEVVDKLMGPLHGDGPAATHIPAGPAIRLLPLAGLPGNGDTALATAMRTSLRSSGLTVVDGEAESDFLLRGQVTVTPGQAGDDVLSVAWTVIARDGRDLGSSAQQGAVPKGRLNGSWGSLAADIAAGGAEGVGEIVRNAKATGADGSKSLATPPSR